jgi:hypothetical protein
MQWGGGDVVSECLVLGRWANKLVWLCWQVELLGIDW